MQASKLKSPKQFKISREVKAFSPDTEHYFTLKSNLLSLGIPNPELLPLIGSFAGWRMVKFVHRALIKVV